MSKKSKINEIYVGDISFEVEEEDLHKLFSVCGSVRAINMLKDAKTGNFKGQAFIRMATDAETRDAINTLDGTRLLNRCISVSAARDKPRNEPVSETAEVKKRPRRERPKRTRK